MNYAFQSSMDFPFQFAHSVPRLEELTDAEPSRPPCIRHGLHPYREKMWGTDGARFCTYYSGLVNNSSESHRRHPLLLLYNYSRYQSQDTAIW